MPTDIHSDTFQDFDQFRKPTGNMGRQVVEGMNHSHYELTTWGLEHVQIRPTDTALDIGCGGGVTVERLAALATNGTVYGIDHSTDCINWASTHNHKAIEDGHVRILQASVEKLPFENATFDKVVAIETVYFWPDLPHSFAEVARVVKPGGQFIIIHECYTCDTFRERNEHWQKTCGMRILAPEEAGKLLKQAGFTLVETHLKEEQNWMCCIATK